MELDHLLEVKDILKKFGGLTALNQISLTIKKEEFLGIIGPNGAGKTTLFNIITGTYLPTRGRIYLRGEDITHKSTDERARKGIIRSFQQVAVFPKLTVLENILQGYHQDLKTNFFKALFQTKSVEENMSKIRHEAHELLGRMGMGEIEDQVAGALPLGIQKKIGIAIALAARPKLLLLDEPVSGLNPIEKQGVMNFIMQFARDKCTCIIIEHHVKTILNYCDRIAVLNFGRKIAEGLPREIVKNREVISAYLGE
jgi:branched-chain amino acid transport system ATP-binding protein